MELTDYQRDILIRTALGEAAGEGKEGMEAVLHVILNRANSGDYSSDPAKVALQKKQFSAWNDTSNGGNNPSKWSTGSKSYKTAAAALDAVLGGAPDPTGGALFYHAKGITPYWADEANTNGVVKIGNHRFYPTHPVPPANIPDVASETDTTPPSPMPARPFGNTRPEDRLDAMLPDQAMYGLKPGGPGPEEMTPGQQNFATGGLDSQQHWGGMAGYNPETRQFEAPEVGDALRTALMPKVPAIPQGPVGRRPPPAPPVSPPTLNDTRREQNTTYRAAPPLPRARPEPPRGFDPLPAPPPLVPQIATAPVPRQPPIVIPADVPAPGARDTSQPLPYPGSTEPPVAVPPSTEPSAFDQPGPLLRSITPSVPAIDPAAMELDRMRLNGYRAIQEMGPSLPPGGTSVASQPPPTTGLIARPITTIAMDPLTNQPLPPTLAAGPRAPAPMPLMPPPMLRQPVPVPAAPMPLRARPQTPYMTSPSYMNTPFANSAAAPPHMRTFYNPDTNRWERRQVPGGSSSPRALPSTPGPRTTNRPPPRNSGRWEGVLDEFGMIL